MGKTLDVFNRIHLQSWQLFKQVNVLQDIINKCYQMNARWWTPRPSHPDWHAFGNLAADLLLLPQNQSHCLVTSLRDTHLQPHPTALFLTWVFISPCFALFRLWLWVILPKFTSFPTSPSETCFDPSFGSQLSSHISFVVLDVKSPSKPVQEERGGTASKYGRSWAGFWSSLAHQCV